MTSSIVLVTGGFDPLHSGHISYFKSAKAIAPLSPLAVGLNSDDWLRRKKGKPFMPMNERISIVRELKMVDAVLNMMIVIIQVILQSNNYYKYMIK